ncbi:MAG: ComEC/Rec2 family competence protein [Verrucomicrobia bacterium]|nr:ComEC/Rec2 family competence protein [Verrucomicrobiota bacterium]
MSRPLVTVAVLYTGGVVLGQFLEFSLGLLFGVAFLFSLAALFFVSLRRFLLWPLIPLAGCVHSTSRTAILSPQDLRLLLGEKAEFVTVRGILSERPVERVYDSGSEPNWRTIAKVDVNELHFAKEWRPAVGRVAVSTPGLLGAQFFTRQRVEISGTLRPPKERVAQGMFDYRAYLSRLGIYYQLIVETTNDWRALTIENARARPPLADRFIAWAQTNLAKGLPCEDEPLRLLWAMALGWKTGLTDEVSEPFMRSGTLHIFAISGLHIALIACILVSVLRVVRVPRAACGLIAIPLLWFYTAATGWQASAIRSTLMMNVIIGGWALNRPSDLVNSLAAAGLIILLWDPAQLFQAGFQLSFFVVLSIGLLLPNLEKVRQRLLLPDPMLPPELRPRWRKLLDDPLRYVTTSLATSLAAWLGSLPLIAYYFYLFTPVSLLANLLIVPLSGLALMCGLGSLVCGDWLPWFTELFNHSGWLWMRMMVSLSHWTAELPGAYFYVRPPTPAEFLIYYPLLGFCASGWAFAPRWRKWAAVSLAGVLAAWAWQWRSEQQTVRLTVLPLGGSGLFFDARGRSEDLLIDCANRASAEFLLRPFLRSQGVKQLPKVLLTHGDINHVGGWPHVKEQFSVSRVFTSPARFRSPVYRQIVRELEAAPGCWQRVSRGDSLSGWTVVHPSADDQFSQADDNAVVLRGQFHGVRILLLSDLGRMGQRTLLEREDDLRADIVVTGLPAQGEPLSPALLDAVNPRLIVVASAEFPASESAGWKLRERLARLRTPVLHTSEVGAVTLILRRNGWEAQTATGRAQIHGAASD